MGQKLEIMGRFAGKVGRFVGYLGQILNYLGRFLAEMGRFLILVGHFWIIMGRFESWLDDCFSKYGRKSQMDIRLLMGCGMGSIYPARRVEKTVSWKVGKTENEQRRRGVVQTARTDAQFLAR